MKQTVERRRAAQTRTPASDEKKCSEKSVWINQVHAQHTPINPLRIPFMLFFILSSFSLILPAANNWMKMYTQQPSQQFIENMMTDDCCCWLLLWRGGNQHQETLIDFTRYTLLLCTHSCVWMMDSDTNFELAFFYGLLIVNDDVNVHHNDWIMLWE